MTDAELCADIARRSARTFSLAAALLPRVKRRGAFAVYAFCREADDIVDRADDAAIGARVQPAASAATRLAEHRAGLMAALGGAPQSPVFRELAWAVETFRIPHEPLLGVLDGVARDLVPTRFPTWAALEEYCAGVASTVGEMCTHVFGVGPEPGALHAALRRARTLGLAMQLTNILRDVGEDAARGRCYLPEEDLATFGFVRGDVLCSPRVGRDADWRAFMQFQVARARSLYQSAEPGIRLLARDAQPCATACAHGYAAILDAIERQSYDTFARRAVVPRWRKASVLWRAWRLGHA